MWTKSDIDEATSTDLRTEYQSLRHRAELAFALRNRPDHDYFERQAARIERELDRRTGLPCAASEE